jgi:hypothetical protein
MQNNQSSCERYPTNAHKQFLLRLLVPLHVSASRCHLQGVTISLFISYSRLSAFRVGVGCCSPGVRAIKTAYEHLLDISHMIKNAWYNKQDNQSSSNSVIFLQNLCQMVPCRCKVPNRQFASSLSSDFCLDIFW